MMIIVRLGERVFAGNAIGESITQFNYMPVFGMATVTVILVAQAAAENSIENVKAYIKKTYWLATIMMFVIGLALLLTANILNQFFTTDRIAMNASTTVILFSFLATFFRHRSNNLYSSFSGNRKHKTSFLCHNARDVWHSLAFRSIFSLRIKIRARGSLVSSFT